jgi:structural maintenance of chromosome 2
MCRRAHDLFHSVQLNVNNPHFLIMQGRITKVLNMKPQEILAMLEEAAGTQMYVEKSKTALNTLQKKEQKLRDIDDVCSHAVPCMHAQHNACGDVSTTI